MKKVLLLLALSVTLVHVVGCANGPIRRLFRGGSCNTCNPMSAFSGPTVDTGVNGCTSCQHPGAFGPADPYYSDTGMGAATLNPPAADIYGGNVPGGMIVPPGATGTLPGPANQ
jgi:hypothetical protein